MLLHLREKWEAKGKAVRKRRAQNVKTQTEKVEENKSDLQVQHLSNIDPWFWTEQQENIGGNLMGNAYLIFELSFVAHQLKTSRAKQVIHKIISTALGEK